MVKFMQRPRPRVSHRQEVTNTAVFVILNPDKKVKYLAPTEEQVRQFEEDVKKEIDRLMDKVVI